MASLTQAARDSGASLVTTLHDVAMALAHFPRILGMREGQLMFDLPPAQVTPERLQALYAQHLDELVGPAPVPDALPVAAGIPVAVNCR